MDWRPSPKRQVGTFKKLEKSLIYKLIKPLLCEKYSKINKIRCDLTNCIYEKINYYKLNNIFEVFVHYNRTPSILCFNVYNLNLKSNKK